MNVRLLLRRLVVPSLMFLFSAPLFASEPQWVEIASPNFRVYTDGGEKRGREIALHFEQLRFAFGKLFQKAKVQTGVPVRVIAFRNSKEFRTVAPVWNGKARTDVAGFFLQGDSVALIALDLSAPQGWAVVFHEYAHLLLNSNVSDTPPWFDEGFAEFYSTIRIDKNEWVIGSFPEYAPQLLGNTRFIPIVDLFSAKHDSPLYNERNHVSIFYAESWLAIEYFWFVDPARRAQLLTYFTLTGEKVPVADALKQAFGKDAAQLDKDFARYFHEGKAQSMTFKKPPALDAMEMKATPLDDVDARATIAELRLNEQEYAQQARAELESILQQKPDQPIAVRGLGYAAIRDRDFKKAAGYFERAMALGSEDPRVYFYWAMATQSGGRYDSETRQKIRAALEKCISLDREMSDAYSLLAFVLAPDDFDAAIKSMKTAISLSPRKPENYINMASLLLSHGQLDEASTLLKQVAQSSEERAAAQARSMLASIEEMKQQRAKYEAANAELASRNQGVRVVLAPDDDAQVMGFSGTLLKVDCQSSSKIAVTVMAGKDKLVLTGNMDDIAVNGKNLSCDLKNARVHGRFDAKKNTLLTIVVE